MTPSELNSLLSRQVESVCQHLLPEGKRQAGEWCVGSVNGEPGESLKVRLSGPKAGIWCDFATGGDDAGDLIDLWRHTQGVGMGVALNQIREWLGIKDSAPTFWGTAAREYKKPRRPKCKPLEEGSSVFEYLIAERRLTKETLDAFKVKDGGDEIVFPYLLNNEPVMVKTLKLERNNGKKITTFTSGEQRPSLFGWQAVPDGARQVIITEGEIDAMSLYQYGFPALSVPYGAGKGEKQRWIETELDNLERFDTILIAMDNDDEGKLAQAEIVDRIGRHRCLLLTLPKKDANECLVSGVDKATIQQAIDSAVTLDPAELRRASSYYDDVIAEFEANRSGNLSGVPVPWEKAAADLRFRDGEVTVWQGYNGHGKSQVLGHVILHTISKGEKACIASMEMRPSKLLRRMTMQATGLQLPSIPYIRAVEKWVDGRLWLFDITKTAKRDILFTTFLYARRRYGVKHFVVDSLLKMGIDEDDLSGQKGFVDALADFAREHLVHVHLVAHSRKSQDEYGPPGKMDVRGSGAITDLVDNVVSVWRNKPKESEVARLTQAGEEIPDEVKTSVDCMLYCTKQRHHDWEGAIGLWYDPQSYQYLGNPSHRPRPYVEYHGTAEVSQPTATDALPL